MLLSVQRSSKSASVLIIFCSALSAQSTSSGIRPDNYIARAKTMFRTFYPNLDPNVTAVVIDGQLLGQTDATMNNFDIQLHDLRPKFGAALPPYWCSSPVLLAHLTFDQQTKEKELVIMSAMGPAVSGKRDKLAKEMDRNHKWSDQEVTTAMNRGGAKFGPDHKIEFLRALPIDELKRLVGELEIVSAEFLPRLPDGGGTSLEPALTWRVEAKWHGPNGENRPCILQFEPFDGRVTSIFRLP